MKVDGRKRRPVAKVVQVDRKGLVRLFNREAQLVGLSGKQALARIKKGNTPDNYLWSDLTLLATMLSRNP